MHEITLSYCGIDLIYEKIENDDYIKKTSNLCVLNKINNKS